MNWSCRLILFKLRHAKRHALQLNQEEEQQKKQEHSTETKDEEDGMIRFAFQVMKHFNQLIIISRFTVDTIFYIMLIKLQIA